MINQSVSYPRHGAMPVISRVYNGLLGVDFSSDPSNVGVQRAADSVNMYRTYSANLGECIQTRPGFRRVSAGLGGAVHGIFSGFVAGNKAVFIHAGTNVYLWSNYPETFTPTDDDTVFSGVEQTRSHMFFNGGLAYFLDGVNYLYFDGNGNQGSVSDIATVPMTSIDRIATGGGEVYEQINLMTPKRSNSFHTDGTSFSYQLDVTGIDDGAPVEVVINGSKVTSGYTVDSANGKIVFTTAPAVANPLGVDNMTITFSKTVSDYYERIANCVYVEQYDNRVFFAGNPEYPNVCFVSMANEPSYIGDMEKYTVGTDSLPITGMLSVYSSLFLLKGNKIYIANGVDVDDELVPRAYAIFGGAECSGCIAPFGFINFRDDPVFISRLGLEGIDKLTTNGSERYVGHRSKRIDGRFCNEAGLAGAYLCEYDAYLCVLIDGKIYLADSRLRSLDGYEWFFWDGIGLYDSDVFHPASVLANLDEGLYFGTDNGYICRFNTDILSSNGISELASAAYVDDSCLPIRSVWAFSYDDFGLPNRFKNLRRRGAVIHARAMPHSRIKVGYRTDKQNETDIAVINSGYFDFSDIDFSDFTFNTFDQTELCFNKRVHKFKRLQIVLYSDEAYRPFGLYSMVLSAEVGPYIKR